MDYRVRAFQQYLASPPPGTILHERSQRWVLPDVGVIFGYRPERGGTIQIRPITTLDSDGYVSVKAQQRQYKGHVIVWESVNGPVPPHHEINHIDFVRHNNRITNLEPLTRRGNSDHSLAADRFHKHPGEASPMAKLTDVQVYEIRLSTLSGKALAERYQVSQALISLIRHRKIWTHI